MTLLPAMTTCSYTHTHTYWYNSSIPTKPRNQPKFLTQKRTHFGPLSVEEPVSGFLQSAKSEVSETKTVPHLKWANFVYFYFFFQTTEILPSKLTLLGGWKRQWRRRDGLSSGEAWELTEAKDSSCPAMGSVNLPGWGFRVLFCNWVERVLSFWEGWREEWYFRSPFLGEKEKLRTFSLSLSLCLGFVSFRFGYVNREDRNDVVFLSARETTSF